MDMAFCSTKKFFLRAKPNVAVHPTTWKKLCNTNAPSNQKSAAWWVRKLKSELYSEISNLNREFFMTILGDVWNKWATLDLIVKSGKRAGMSINGLQQDKFRCAEALLEPAVSSPPSSSGSPVLLSSPVGVWKKTSAYYLYKLNKLLDW